MAKQRLFYTCVLICLGSYVLCVQFKEIGNGVCISDTRNSRHLRRYVCCPNYTQIYNGTNTRWNPRPKCEPICNPGCHNGACIKPGECSCYIGFTADPMNNRNCLPTCYDGCSNGVCVSPDICECNHGYVLNNSSICSPVCTEPCSNGTCVSPENCLCNTGYRKSATNNYLCEPYCSAGCNDGHCVGPEVCECGAGWKLVGSNTCTPICSPSCFNGICVAPNKCECNPGYGHPPSSWSYTCLPLPTTSTETTPAQTMSITSKPGASTARNGGFDNTTETVLKNSATFPAHETSVHVTAKVDNTSVASTTEVAITTENQDTWIYITVGLVVLLLATLLLLGIVLKRKLYTCIKGGSYVVEDSRQRCKDRENSFSVTFSSTSHK